MAGIDDPRRHGTCSLYWPINWDWQNPNWDWDLANKLVGNWDREPPIRTLICPCPYRSIESTQKWPLIVPTKDEEAGPNQAKCSKWTIALKITEHSKYYFEKIFSMSRITISRDFSRFRLLFGTQHPVKVTHIASDNLFIVSVPTSILLGTL